MASQSIDKLTFSNSSDETDSSVQLDWQDRMVVITHYGFLPSSSEELNCAMSVLDYFDTTRKVGGHLNEIILHNKKHKAKDPAAAAKSVVRNFEFWANDALEQVSKSVLLHSKLHLVNPHISALEVIDTEDQQDSETIFQSIEPIVKQAKLEQAIESGDRDVLITVLQSSDGGKLEKSARSTNNHITEKDKTDFLAKHSVREIREMADKLTDTQTRRFEFWRQAIQQSDNHYAVRALVKQILPRIDKTFELNKKVRPNKPKE